MLLLDDVWQLDEEFACRGNLLVWVLGALCFQFLVGGREGVYELLRISEASFILGLNFHCF